jgi:hypothetical protein
MPHHPPNASTQGRGIEAIQGFQAEPAVAADGAGITASRGVKPSQPAPLLNVVGSRSKLNRLATVEESLYG